RPIPALDTSNRFGLVEPFVIHTTHTGGDRCHDIGRPLPTVTTAKRGEKALIEPYVIGQHSGATPRSVDEPLPTVATAGAIALIEPFFVKYYGSGIAKSVDCHLDTVTTRDRYMLVEPVTGRPVAELDIRFRMLQPHELAGAQGFPANYKFVGTREE